MSIVRNFRKVINYSIFDIVRVFKIVWENDRKFCASLYIHHLTVLQGLDVKR